MENSSINGDKLRTIREDFASRYGGKYDEDLRAHMLTDEGVRFVNEKRSELFDAINI